MSQPITLTWRGHSCYKITCGDYSLVLDPFADGTVPGYGNVRETANEVFCSHEHGDHGYREAVTIVSPDAPSPFTVTTIDCPHDDAGGSLRGMNRIHIFDNGSLRIAHFGDIGCMLEEEQLEQLGGLDAALVPVGGHFTMEPDGIAELMERITPRVVVPMHYRSENLGYPVIGTLDAYLQYVKGDIVTYEGNTLELTKATPSQTAILTYQG